MRAARPSTTSWSQFAYLWLNLTLRDVRIRYKQSLLGMAWAVVLPLSMMFVFTLVLAPAVERSGAIAGDVPYALFVYTGLVPWTFFSSGLTACVNSLVANRNLVTKTYFPREVFPLSCIGSGLVDFLIALTVLFLMLAWYDWTGRCPTHIGSALVALPLITLIQVALMIGVGMVLAMANLFYRDVRPMTGVVVQLLMFVSSVVVPIPRDGSRTAELMALNPLVAIMESYRECLLHNHWPDPGALTYAAAVAGVTLVAGVWLFRRMSHRFAECI